MMPDNASFSKAQLETAWSAVLYENSLRGGTLWNFIWGGIAIVMGFLSLGDTMCNAFLILIGAFLIFTGINTQRQGNSEKTFALEAAAFLLLGGWNMAISIINLTASRGYDGYDFSWDIRFMVLSLFQIGWGIDRLIKRGKYKQVAGGSQESKQYLRVILDKMAKGIPKKEASMLAYN